MGRSSKGCHDENPDEEVPNSQDRHEQNPNEEAPNARPDENSSDEDRFKLVCNTSPSRKGRSDEDPSDDEDSLPSTPETAKNAIQKLNHLSFSHKCLRVESLLGRIERSRSGKDSETTLVLRNW
jgi:hypothetical protein